MASIGYLLMNEFHAEAKAEKARGNFDRAFIFDHAENTVNNFLHGRTPSECLSLVKNVLANPPREIELNDAELAAYADAVIIAEQYHVTLTN
jgi:hypothetical protein